MKIGPVATEIETGTVIAKNKHQTMKIISQNLRIEIQKMIIKNQSPVLN